MPRSFLVKKHMSYRKPNYGRLESQKKEEAVSSQYPFEGSMIANISQPEFPTPASCAEALEGWASRPLVTSATPATGSGAGGVIKSMPVNTQPQHTDSSRANLGDEPLLTFKTTNYPLRDSLNSLTSLDVSRSRIGGIAFEETGCLPAPFLLGPECRGLLPCVQEKFECFDCHKAYYTFSGLAKHRQLQCEWQCHKYFNCKYCDKEYVSLGALKMHIRTHTLPCVCKLCGKAFSRPWLLQGHIRTHTGEKPFSCPHCSRAFADRSNLRAHLQTHSDVKKYHCKCCAKTFSRMSLLSKHEEAGCPPLSPDTLQGLPGST
ncbi:hypothetical protein AOXY_G18236 [Acipenser oxyrinchus oxyrinchus]|uniref:Zinc finger protein SNAI2 n=1 Tax=Acipenser oxyrinchus oxyrinchus TaxID=40147 RepID=A0AAD8D4B1_ACIOX|nr:hypothetical protein AOXY_G18236 [Acipenser oxyrinchus oxyrinchus]